MKKSFTRSPKAASARRVTLWPVRAKKDPQQAVPFSKVCPPRTLPPKKSPPSPSPCFPPPAQPDVQGDPTKQHSMPHLLGNPTSYRARHTKPKKRSVRRKSFISLPNQKKARKKNIGDFLKREKEHKKMSALPESAFFRCIPPTLPFEVKVEQSLLCEETLHGEYRLFDPKDVGLIKPAPKCIFKGKRRLTKWNEVSS